MTVPNSVIGKGLVVNFTVPDTQYRIETTVGVAYDSDVSFVRTVLGSAIKRQDWVLTDRPVDVLFTEFGDSALNFKVRCFIADYLDRWHVLDRLNSVIFEALNEHKIGIPFPQRDLHIISSNLPSGNRESDVSQPTQT